MANGSIFVLEDIDYIIELHDGLVSASLKNNQEHHHEEENKIEELIITMEVTLAEVAEQLLKNDDPGATLSSLIEFHYMKKKEIEEAKI
ncbi:hypothetical protein LguiA_005793 [Lonicera macranthoides]